ncbi:LysR family transcriptional regulator [Kitasatospora viridis]|uniref:LysR family transcriptional regulator n=1 Tax=Kitasatospora viridis TaxID=281105 RepID=A0A561TSD6_9ACTN|nr:LysR family transcriptional regulator [Kitasatospora viridis]TWF90026.1 LysR family transcriptional regulator [Kitasatospora viridis]
MELRDIEIFLVLAEELHFGRTAERLGVSRARVSQSVKKQERRIGGLLFDRTSRTVRLTPIGRRLRDDLRAAQEQIQQALARAGAAARGLRGTVRLGTMGVVGGHLRWLVSAFTAQYPDCDVEFVEIHPSDPFRPLRDGRVDAALLWLPVREPGLAVGPIVLTEGQVLGTASGSDLADRAAVHLEDLGGRTVPDPGPLVPAYWIEHMLPARTPAGRLISRGSVGGAATFHEMLPHIAAGRVVAPVNAHVQWAYNPPGVVWLPISDAALTEWALVWARANESLHLNAFVETARELGPRPISADG